MTNKKTQKVDLWKALESLSDTNQNLVKDFLRPKTSESSKKNYLSPIIRTFELLDNKEATEFTVEDYELTLINFDNQESNIAYVKSFFRYVQQKCSLKDNDRFVSRFYEEKNITRAPKKSKSSKQKYNPVLTFEQIQKLQDFLALDFEDDISKLKSSFACYMLFCTDCQKEELSKEIKATDYNDGRLVSASGKEYDIPVKYEPIFEKKKDLQYTGFDNLYKYLKPIEAVLQIDKLKPQVLINARNQNTMKCSACGTEYINIANNWVSIGGRVICKTCGEELKKNSSFNIELLKEFNVDRVTISEETDKAAFIFGYDKLKKRMLNSTYDFNALNKFKELIGQLGEAYIYKLEKTKLKDTKYFDMVSDSPAMNPTMGYDIKSFTEEGDEIFIEVKTEAKEKHNDFFISEHEKKMGENLIKQGKKYLIYRVHNILAQDETEVKLDIIEDAFTNPKYTFNVAGWKVSV